MPVCMVLVELAITCVHDYMVVNVTVTKDLWIQDMFISVYILWSCALKM